MEPKEVKGWNVAELAGGLLLSADDFTVQFSVDQVDDLLDILNSELEGDVRDVEGNLVHVSHLGKDAIVLTRANDKVYPYGIILPVDAFSDMDDDEAPIVEGIKPTWRRVGSKIKRGYRVTSGFRKGRVMAHPTGASAPRAAASTRRKLSVAAKRNKFKRMLKSKLTRHKTASMQLHRLNQHKYGK